MKWSRPIGLFLTTLCMVHSMPPQTTTRYTSLEGYNRFSLNSTQNPDASNISSYFSDIPLESNAMNFTEQLKYNILYEVNSFKNNNFNNSAEASRKLRRNPTKNQNLYSNFVTNTFGSAANRNKTMQINTVNRVSTKVNKHTNTTTKTTSKTSHVRTSNVKVPDSKKNTNVALNVKNGINVVTTKAPFKIKINKVTTPTTKSHRTVYRTTTSVPLLIKLTKFTTSKPKQSTTVRHASKHTEKPLTIKLSRPNVKNITKHKEKPTIHKIITKWSDNPDLSQVKQDWYEVGVPYPNPNPEISSFSPPVSLSDIGSPVVSDFSENFNYPNPNPEISSFSPPISLSDVSSISPGLGEFAGNDYPNLNPEISSYSPPVSLNELSSVAPLGNDYGGNANYPNPLPEISSYSPSYSVNDVPPITSDIPEIANEPSNPSGTGVGNPISVFNLDMVPDGTKQASTGGGSPCPTVHISSSLLSSRQMECSDLNLVINSHFHQNQNGGGGTRNPAVSTYDAAQDAAVAPVQETVPLEGESEALAGQGVANSGAPFADPGVGGVQAADTAAAAPQAPAAAPSGGTGGSGGSGGDGNDGSGGIRLPDLKNMFEAIGYLWNGLCQLLSFLRNPYLYIIPMILFFALSFFTILALFPWWIPLLLLYLSVKTHKTPKDTVTFYNHIHKPIHHPDGWFWNHQTKTWQNVQDFPYTHKRNDRSDKRVDNIEAIINRSKSRYEDNKSVVQTWKRRRRSK